MSEHQSGADGAPDRGPGVDVQGQGRQGTAGGCGETQSGTAPGMGQGGSQAYGQTGGAESGQPGYGGSSGVQPGYGSAQGNQQGYAAPQGGQGDSMGPQSLGAGQPMYGGAGAMPPGYGQAQYVHPHQYPEPPYAQPAMGPGYYAAPHPAQMYYGQYAGYPPPPPPPPPGVYPPDAFQAMHQGAAHGVAQGAGQAHGASMSDLVNEVANGGNGLSALSKILNFDDPDFWKGALVGAAAVLLLTSDSVQGALFGSGANGNGNGGEGSST